MKKAVIALFLFILVFGSGLYYLYSYVEEKQLLEDKRTEALIQEQKQIVQDERQSLGKIPEHVEYTYKAAPRVEFSPHIQREQTSYRCDGRTKCGQMHSLEEARWFINHCPDTKMDGDHDGEPCENDSRWH